MGLALVLGPAVEPVSLAEVKAHLRVNSADDDALLTGYIIAAREYAENYIRGAMVTQTRDYTIDYCWPLVRVNGYLQNRIELPLHPVQTVTSVTYVDENGATQTLSSSLYTVCNYDTVSYIVPSYGATWPAVRGVPVAITVRFVCGYPEEAVPEPIKLAILMHVQSIYDCNEKESCETCRDSLLDPYRVLRVA